jgi:hypothetical protein
MGLCIYNIVNTEAAVNREQFLSSIESIIYELNLGKLFISRILGKRLLGSRVKFYQRNLRSRLQLSSRVVG